MDVEFPGDTGFIMPAGSPSPSVLITGMLNVVADWSTGSAQTIFTTAAAINGFTILQLVGRTPTGTQPITYTLKINGTVWGAAISIPVLTGNAAQLVPNVAGQLPVLGPSQLITVTPAAASAGSMLFDTVGYFL